MSVETEASAAPRRRLSGPARRTAILQAAVPVFAGRGYGATGMAELAEEAGVTRAVLYDHFASKRDLFIAALNEQSAVFLGHVGAHIAGDGSPRERMRSTVDAVFSFAERHPHAWKLIHSNDVHGDLEVDLAWQEVRRSRAEMVTRMLAQDLTAAGIDPGSRRADLMVEMLIGALSAGAEEWRRAQRDSSREELVEIAMSLLWSGMSRASGHVSRRADLE